VLGADLEVSAYAGFGATDFSSADGACGFGGYGALSSEAVEFLPCGCAALRLHGPDGGVGDFVFTDLSVCVFFGFFELGGGLVVVPRILPGALYSPEVLSIALVVLLSSGDAHA
jgi:hypothetical protein